MYPPVLAQVAPHVVYQCRPCHEPNTQKANVLSPIFGFTAPLIHLRGFLVVSTSSRRRRCTTTRSPSLNILSVIKVPSQLLLQLATLQTRHVLGGFDGVLFLRVSAGEDDVEFFEAAALGFREEEPDAGEDGGVEYACCDLC